MTHANRPASTAQAAKSGKNQVPRRAARVHSNSFDYSLDFKQIDFRQHPELYRVGRGEQGVLLVEPYKSEILPHWRFADEDKARLSSEKIFELFLNYLDNDDFVGADMARKFLQMGFTRARRYANHAGGRKYDEEGNVRPQEDDALSSPKAEAATVFYEAYKRALEDPRYQQLKAAHQRRP